MIHELIDPKKKAIRGNASKNAKAFNDYSSTKTFFDGNNIHFEHSDNENKETGSQSNTFIPPWLRNSLGLSQRNNQSHVVSDQKATKTIPKCKEQINNATGGMKSNASADCAIRMTCNLDGLPRKYSADINNFESVDASSIKCNERATTVLGNNVRRESDNGSLSAVSDVKVPKREESKVMQEELNDTFENEKVKEEEKKKLKGRQKIKIKKRNLNEITGDFTCKNDAECLMEIKGKEMSDNYETKNVNSVSSDVKQSDVKLILLGAKCRDADASKINEEDLPTLQEIKEKNGNEEDLEKFLNHIRDSKVKEGLKISNGLLKINSDKIRKEDVKMNKSAKEIIKDIKLNKKEIKPNSDRESLKSTDEENDIKRFSEFLSKNKNIEEKKKCLEEVRNYFDRKRRTRLTKRRCNDDCKIQKREDGPLEKKDDFPKEKSSPTKETVISGKEKKGAYVPCNEEVVEKAVSETLQKFLNLYHFHVSPSVMGTMRKNILEAIQFDSVDSNSSKKNLTPQGNSSENPPGETIQVLGVKNSENFKNLNEETELQVALNPEIVAPSEPLLNTDFEELKKPQFKALGTSAKIQMTHPLQEKNAVESENFKRLKKELENCLEPAQPEADEIGLKIQSLVLENEETSQAKGERFVYDFSKKSLEFAQLDFNPEKPSLRGNNDTKKNQDVETQTYSKPEPIKKSIRIQTIAFFGGREQGLQTDDAIYANNYAQTEFADNELKILSDLNDLEISPGLYRLVKSKNIGRFYLYPEKNKSLEMETSANDVDFSASKCKHYDSFLGESAGGKKLMLKGKLTKEMRILYKEKDSGKIYGTKKKNTTKSTSQRFHRKKSPNADDSVSCLFFRKAVNDSQSCEMSSQLEQEFSLSNVDASPESIQVTSRDDHFGCIWFWNGEKITPGSDLKTRVEDLLKEKLNEINHLSKNSIKINETSRIEDKTSPSQDKYEEDKKFRSSKALEKKSFKDVGTQNSQQTCLSLSLNKIKSQSKTSIISKVSTNSKNESADVKMLDSSLCKKNADNLAKALKQIKKLKLQENMEKQATSEKSSEFGRSTSSSKTKNYSENSSGSPTELKKQTETVNSEAEIPEISNFKTKKLISKFDKKILEPKMLSHKHWELIESVLNRASLKERGLWSDLRHFIKKKIGRDINDEGAQEVCIEIEQEVPKTESGKMKQGVMARGHYIKNKGDIEVEIDLTLDDLERILRQRQKKMRRQKVWNSKKAKKLFSSSSAQNSLTRSELRRNEKRLRKGSILTGFETEKS